MEFLPWCCAIQRNTINYLQKYEIGAWTMNVSQRMTVFIQWENLVHLFRASWLPVSKFTWVEKFAVRILRDLHHFATIAANLSSRENRHVWIYYGYLREKVSRFLPCHCLQWAIINMCCENVKSNEEKTRYKRSSRWICSSWWQKGNCTGKVIISFATNLMQWSRRTIHAFAERPFEFYLDLVVDLLTDWF